MPFEQQGQQVDTQINVAGDATIGAVNIQVAAGGQVTIPGAAVPPESRRVPVPPAMSHDFYGRTTELAALTAALAGEESVLISGLPGIGKATITQEAWRRIHSAGGFGGGCIWVDDVGDGSLDAICDAVASSLRAPHIATLPPGRKPDALRELLAGNPGHLLVLENVTARETAVAFVARCLTPANSLVVTSSDYLNVATFDLRLPELDDATAEALFRHCAEAADGEPVGDICRLLANHPEALVVAAGLMRRRGYSVEQLQQRLERNLEKTLARDEPNFWSSFSAAYTALAPEVQVVLDTLAAAAGTSMHIDLLGQACELDEFDREDYLHELVAMSQVQREPETHSLRVQTLYRRYVRGQLGAERIKAIRRQIAFAVVPFVKGVERRSEAGMDVLERELNNILPSIETAAAHQDWGVVLQIVRPISHHTQDVLGRRGYWPQLAQVCARGMEAATALGDPVWPHRFRHRLAAIRQLQGDFASARLLYRDNETLFRQRDDAEYRQGLAFTLNSLGDLARSDGDLDAAQQYWHESLAIKQQLGLPPAATEYNLGALAYLKGDLAAARGHFERSLADDKARGKQDGEALNRLQLGRIALHQGRLSEGREHLAAGLALNEAIGDADGMATAQLEYGRLHLITGDYAAAESALQAALAGAERLQAKTLHTDVVYEWGHLAIWQNVPEVATQRLQASLSAYEELGNPIGAARCRHLLGVLALAAGDVAAAETLLASGEGVFAAKKLRRDLVDARREWGRLALARGDVAAARQALDESAALAGEIGYVWGRGRALYERGLLAEAAEAETLLTESVTLLTLVASPLATVAGAALESVRRSP